MGVQVVRQPCNSHARDFHDTEQATAFGAVPTGFVTLPKRWVVERTHAWNERSRRLGHVARPKPLIAAFQVWFSQARRLVSRLTPSNDWINIQS